MIEDTELFKLLSKNLGYFEYNPINGKISVFYRENVILDNEVLISCPDTKEYKISEDTWHDLIDFFNIAESSCSRNQISFKANKNGVERCYLLTVFERNERKDIIYGTLDNISSLLIEQDKLIELSKKDALTGVLNNVNTKKYVKKCVEEKGFFILCMVDLDYFKLINDTYGHIYGDKVLCIVAEQLKKIVGNDGEVGRVGGDEFVLVKKYKSSPSDSDKRELLRNIKNYFLGDENKKYTLRLTTTIGCVTYPFDGCTFEELYLHLDKALYRGKVKGRNCYIIYNEQLHGKIDTKKPIQDTVVETFNGTLDASTFISDILGSLLETPTKTKTLEKIKNIAMYFRVHRITIYEHLSENIKPIYSLNITNKNIDPIEIVDYDAFLRQFENDIFVAYDVFEYKFDIKKKFECMNIPYAHGSVVMSACGINRNMDYIFSVEIFDKRRLWNLNQLTALKILSRLIMTFYMKG